MNRDEFETILPLLGTVEQYWKALEKCFEDELALPILTLTYSMIDAMAWLGSELKEEHVRNRFENWVQHWLLSRGHLDCTSTDLYAARCAVLHTMTADSGLSGKGDARRIIYHFDYVDPNSLDELTMNIDEKFVVMNINRFSHEVKEACICFLGGCDTDLQLQTRILKKAQKFYSIFPDWGEKKNKELGN